MLRNREIRVQLALMVSSSAVMAAAAAFVWPAAALMLVFASFILIGISLMCTRWRYRDIEKLTGYLHRIEGGDYSLDIRDNEEGELSILKNEIYKLTLMLTERELSVTKDNTQLTDAISDISHQLKSPLTSMMVMADLLSGTDLPAGKRKEFTRHIQIQLERMEWLVSSLLKLAKLDAGAVDFKREPIEVKKLIQQALEPLLIPIDIKGQNILVKGEEKVSFYGDFKWTTEAIVNILKNGVEHTREGGTIEVCFTENALYTELAIKDKGEGISKEDLPYIFKRFHKGRNAAEGSIGIGLSLAYSIITRQNGVIDVSSVIGSGTEFRIKFYKQAI
ncbi:sensor histidine kinase [Bacillus sp. 1P06AnD]|uniref:sensor histidine kinase n=1 Tax=Bacillus sp. 1P06AnD TaxID=3132208 RepID=UPI0039A33B18